MLPKELFGFEKRFALKMRASLSYKWNWFGNFLLFHETNISTLNLFTKKGIFAVFDFSTASSNYFRMYIMSI